MGFNFSVAVWVGYIALFETAVETGVVMVIYLHERLPKRIAVGTVTNRDIEAATIEGAVQRLRPKLMTVAVVMLSLAPILWESGIGSDVMKPIAAPIGVGFTLYPGGCARILPRLRPLANRLVEADSVEVRNSMT
jgi:Cu(I)/Ag(I) efflux system membrane protein CusA/SilA